MEKIAIQPNNAAKRIDKFLAEEFFLYSRGEIAREIKNGKVLINGKKIKPSYVLLVGDEVLVEDLTREKFEDRLVPNDKINFDIIFENEDFVIINKPAGLQVHPSFNEKENTLANGLIAQFPDICCVHDESEGAELRPGIVHRLDKDTSGVMVVARNMQADEIFKKAFKNREIEKQYIAVSHGVFAEKRGQIEKPIARSTNYRKQVIARSNTKTVVRNALTFYEVIGEFQDFSVVRVFPKTGRMHQIRIHLASIGHPIVGDLVYGHVATQKGLIEAKRQLLHAEKIKFNFKGQEYIFFAEMPWDFADFLGKLKEKKAGDV